jgi:hypothetical protein
MTQSIVPTFLRLNNFPKYPKRNDLAFSINQDEDSNISLKADKSIWELYEKAEKKVGRLGAYNQIHDSISNTEKDLSLSLKAIEKLEKHFRDYLEHIAERGIYAEVTPKIKDQLQEALNKYPVINYQRYPERYDFFSSELIQCVVLIEKYSKVFKQIPLTKLSLKSLEVKEAIYHFDYLHVLHFRLTDFLDLIKKDGIHKKLNKGEFVRSQKIVEAYNSSKKGPSIDERIYYDIEKIFNKYFSDPERSSEISKIVDFALSEEWFVKKWSDEHPSNEQKGLGKRTLITRFSELLKYYEK